MDLFCARAIAVSRWKQNNCLVSDEVKSLKEGSA